MAENRVTYGRKHSLTTYSRESKLFPAEFVIFGILERFLPTARMIDIGVGCGRTTRYFYPLVKEYVASDYAPAMIESCRRRFHHFDRAMFLVMDAADMRHVCNDRFEFVIFSYNGIDSVSPTDRRRVLAEMRRICTADGYCCMSSHNIRHFRKRYLGALHGGVGERMCQIVDRIALRIANRTLIAGGLHAPWAIVRDGSQRFGLKLYYAEPAQHLRELLDAGFTDIRAFRANGTEVQCSSLDDPGITDPWITYLFKPSKAGEQKRTVEP